MFHASVISKNLPQTKDRLKISFLTLSEFKQINQLLFPPEIIRQPQIFSRFQGNKS